MSSSISDINSLDNIKNNENKIFFKYYYFHWCFQLVFIFLIKILTILNNSFFDLIYNFKINWPIKILWLLIILISLLKNKKNIFIDYVLFFSFTFWLSLILNNLFFIIDNSYFIYSFYLIFINSLIICLKLNFSYDLSNSRLFSLTILLNTFLVFYVTQIYTEIDYFYKFLLTVFIIFFLYNTNLELFDIDVNKENYILNSIKLWFFTFFVLVKISEKITKIFVI